MVLRIYRWTAAAGVQRLPIATMASNWNTKMAWEYHEATKHSYASIRANPHFLDWANQPVPFKIYPTLERVRLPGEVRPSGSAALSAIAESVPPDTVAVPDVVVLAQLLYLSAGITRQRKYPGGEIYFRAAACTGALYEVELYLVCGDLANLETGLYHFAPAEFGLRRLRVADYRAVLVEATAAEPAIAHAPVVIACTCIYWRNAWKYQARTYRHFGWDNGTVLANLLAVATALGLPAKVVCGFQDAEVNRLLDVDPQREVAFSLVALGHVSALPPQPPSEISSLGPETVPPPGREVENPLMREIHAASSLHTADDPPGAQLNQLYLIVHAVEGLESGAYVFYRDRGMLGFLKPGNFRAQAGHLGLDQELAADAAVDIFFLVDLRPVLQRFGNRGYRAVQLEAGILGGKLYLAAYAQHLGATGLTFYDDEVVRFFSPHAEGKSAIFLVAIGKSAKQKLQET